MCDFERERSDGGHEIVSGVVVDFDFGFAFLGRDGHCHFVLLDLDVGRSEERGGNRGTLGPL